MNKQELNFDTWPNLPDQEIWENYIQLRKGKKAPINQTLVNSLSKLFSELPSLTVDEILEECVFKGWQGAKADWFEDLKTSKVKTNKAKIITDTSAPGKTEWCQNCANLVEDYHPKNGIYFAGREDIQKLKLEGQEGMKSIVSTIDKLKVNI